MTHSLWRFLVSACVALSLVVLCPGLGGVFVFDDVPNIVENVNVHLEQITPSTVSKAAFSYQPGHGSRPLAMLSFAVDYWRAGGLDATAFKVTNLLVHGLTVLCIAGFTRRLLLSARWGDRDAHWAALAVALAWGVHPLQVSSALYVVQRMQTLSTLFTVLACWAYLLAREAQIKGRAGWGAWTGVVVASALGFLCKEDVVLLPLYTAALELTVLQFRAAPPNLAKRWVRIYGLGAMVAAIGFLVYFVPAYWHADAYPGRSFSSAERLLTQARILVMYIGQMVLPTPANLPFYYDGLQPSTGLMAPVTTLLSLIGLAVLLAVAVALRKRLPVFALGVLLFFAGHFLTSNILNLELAFEHRNHWPLFGILLAAADLVRLALVRLRPSQGMAGIVGSAFMVTLCVLTAIRASVWGSPFQFALQGPEWAPESPRAWQMLCKTYYERSGGAADHPFFSLAVQSCEKAAALPGVMVPLADLITLKAIQGDDASADWSRLQDRLEHGVLSPEGRDAFWTMVGNADKGVPLDGHQMAKTAMALGNRESLSAVEVANVANYLLYHSVERERAYGYYLKALQQSRPGDPLKEQLLRDLTENGMKEWADRLNSELTR